MPSQPASYLRDGGFYGLLLPALTFPLHIHVREALDMKSKKFTQFVNRVLLLLNPPCIENFQLIFCHKYCDPFYLESWILAAIGRTFQKLELYLVLAQPMELPLSHFCCKTLAVLTLDGDIHFNAAASASICFPNLLTLHLDEVLLTIASNCSVSFPSLKNMFLDCVKYTNEESVHKLFASCPVLDNLKIYRDFSDNILCLIISIPSLRSLKTNFHSPNWIPYEAHGYRLQIDTPALKYLYLDDYCMCEYFTAENLSSLLEARVTFGFDGDLTVHAYSYSVNIFNFMRGLFNVKFLSISVAILKTIRCISANISLAFHNLTELQLHGNDCCDWSVVINNILDYSCNLKHLFLNGRECDGSHLTWWTEPLCVPMCLLRRVTTISLRAMHNGCSDELEMVRYFLKNAEALELLTVNCSSHLDKKCNLMEKISMMPRGSRACQVAFE